MMWVRIVNVGWIFIPVIISCQHVNVQNLRIEDHMKNVVDFRPGSVMTDFTVFCCWLQSRICDDWFQCILLLTSVPDLWWLISVYFVVDFSPGSVMTDFGVFCCWLQSRICDLLAAGYLMSTTSKKSAVRFDDKVMLLGLFQDQT